jgi:hypothetical protein
MSDPRGSFDIAVDRIVTVLENYSTTDAVNDPSYAFEVQPDYYRTHLPSQTGAHVFVYLGPVTPQAQRSATVAHYTYTANYYLDCVVVAKGKTGAQYERGDKLAGERLRYLIQQVLTALDPARNHDLGLSDYEVGKRPMPRIEPLPPDIQQGERPIAGARITLELPLVWEPTKLTGTDLEQIDVSSGGYFDALFDYT